MKKKKKTLFIKFSRNIFLQLMFKGFFILAFNQKTNDYRMKRIKSLLVINDRVIYPENRCNLSCYDDGDDGMQAIKLDLLL